MRRIAKWIAILGVVTVTAGFGQEKKPLDATNVEELRAHSGQDVVVQGIVSRVGSTSTKSITFINLGPSNKQGFVAVVFQKNYGAFPEGLEGYKGKNLMISGTLNLYQGNTPQIEVRSPDQIQIVKQEE